MKTKVNHAAPAHELYVSTLFRGRRAFVEVTCDRWFILSARHGLVGPEEVLEPYEETLNDNSVGAKRAWATSVLCQLESSVSIAGTVFEIHAGAEYRNFGLVNELLRHGATVEIPAEHLGRGEQLAFYSRSRSAGVDERVSRSAVPRSGIPAARGSYTPLAEHLCDLEASYVQLSFSQIERVLGRPLPASARRHRAWWANESRGTHSHAAAWMEVDWLVDTVDFNAGTVRFRRGRR
ncbi:MAG: hypothetical protein M3404_01665 [Actinomycetota bacterium]|nr:hypothetical protein [Actinomycetota bacterium]